MSLIRSAAYARACIGKTVWWDDHGGRYVFLRSGIVTDVQGGNIGIDHNWLWRKRLTALRTTSEGGAFRKGEV